MQLLAEEFQVVDTDTHIIEPYDLWTSRMSVRKWGDRVPHVKWDERAGEDAWYFGDERVFSAGFSAHAGWNEYFPDTPKRLSDVSPALWRAEDRLKLMDAYGIHSQILFPNVAGFGAGRYLALADPVLMLECLQAYNDWLSDWSSAAPARFIPQMAMPLWDVDACVREMERCALKGHKGVVMSADPSPFGLPKLSDPHWDTVWAVAQEMGLPINFHVASGDPGAMAFLKGRADASLAILDQRLANRAFVLGNRPTIADISLCAYLYYPAEEFGFDIAATHQNIAAWLDRIKGLPGWKHPYDLMPGHPPAL